MNIQDVMTDLHKLLREWERNASSPDLIGRAEWARGVIYGIKLVMNRVRRQAAAQD